MACTDSQLPFDRAHLSTFTGGDMDLERELLEDFLKNAGNHVDALEKAIGTPQWPECAHKLKGAASGVGMRGLAVLCGAAEAQSAPSAWDAETMVREMRRHLSSLSAFLQL